MKKVPLQRRQRTATEGSCEHLKTTSRIAGTIGLHNSNVDEHLEHFN